MLQTTESSGAGSDAIRPFSRVKFFQETTPTVTTSHVIVFTLQPPLQKYSFDALVPFHPGKYSPKSGIK